MSIRSVFVRMFWRSSAAVRLSSAGCHIFSLRRAAWQREEEAARDEGGYQGPTCPHHRKPNAFLFAFPSLRFRIPQTRIAYTHIQPHPYTHTHPRSLAELCIRGAHSPVDHYFLPERPVLIISAIYLHYDSFFIILMCKFKFSVAALAGAERARDT